MSRRADWPERLAEFIEARRHEPFAWGANDCALFAADCVHMLTDVDHAANLRGYKTERGAIGKIKRAGGLRAFASELPEKHTGLAQRGDVVLADMDGRETFGICAGNGFWCGPGPDGIVFRPMAEAVAAFEV